ncbi:serine hydrolase [Croceicoccus sp. Ery5]|uniref:serine hydrolase domain-containing protein n=1 Tax=Croceicoccus sp. Ery5 TaxID=1703340 RepID=UPI001E473153|nr:serine hydrolase domain-containing protein [Croceicoccus sp. Ery5]
MTTIIRTGAATLGAMVVWSLVVLFAANEGWFKTPLTPSSSPERFIAEVAQIEKTEHRGNFSMLLVENGQIVGEYHASLGQKVDHDSVFQVASLSKWLTAWGVMTLVDDGVVDLDAPVADYLKRWRIPSGEFDTDGVTVRRLLSHTAGLDDGLGYSGFANRDEVQTLADSLTQAADASEGKSGMVRVGHEPGSKWQYSGGGYTLLQLLIEDASGETFTEYMKRRVFDPLRMTRTSFDFDRAAELGLAENFDTAGVPIPFRRYTALAATSLFTTTRDIGLFLMAQAPEASQPVLSKETLAAMQVPQAQSTGADIWGIGPMLFAPNDHDGFIIGHDGNNEPSINTAARLNPATGDGIVVFETGSPLFATRIAGEWVFWKTGRIDNLAFVMGLEDTIFLAAVGSILILIVGAAWASVKRKKNRVQH